MGKEDKPFICYKKSKWVFHISPSNAAGWRWLGLWLLPVFLLIGVMVAISAFLEKRGVSEPAIALVAAPFLLAGTTVWAIAMIRWMLARSEIIDLNELMALKQEKERRRR